MLDCLVFTPVGPGANLEYVRDTVDSFLFFLGGSSTAMLLLDDTVEQRLEDSLDRHDGVHFVRSADLMPNHQSVRKVDGRKTYGRLFVVQILALKHMAMELDWRCLLRLDDDALIIGPAPHLDALHAFDEDRSVGMLGAYLRRGDGSNKLSAMADKGRGIHAQIRQAHEDCDAELASYISALCAKARTNGYVSGHMCTGGAFFLARSAFDAFAEAIDVDSPLSRAVLDDDLLFSMHTWSEGYQLKDFSDPEHIMAVNWRGLPMPLEKLCLLNKKVLHPVKDINDPGHEMSVRSFFRSRRV